MSRLINSKARFGEEGCVLRRELSQTAAMFTKHLKRVKSGILKFLKKINQTKSLLFKLISPA